MSGLTSSKNPSRGHVWQVDFGPVIGREQSGFRPALIISHDSLNRSPAELLIVAPITGTDRGIPAHVRVSPPMGGLTKPSFIMVDQIRTISKQRLGRRLGVISPAAMSQVEECLRFVLGL